MGINVSGLGFTNKVEVEAAQRSEFLEFACATAKAAGQAALPFFRSDVKVDNKLEDGKFDPVTEADRAAEQVVRKAIELQFPQHGILGEEFGYKAGNGLTWIIDPIDGTRAFMSGMLHWGVLIGLFDGEDVIAGVMYQPYTDELFFGDGSSACMRSGGRERMLAASEVVDLGDATLACTGPDWFNSNQSRQFDQLSNAVQMRRFGGDCYLFAMLAMGYIDIAMEASLNAYDIAALVPIIRGAGGVITTYDGGNPCLGGPVLASGNKTLHAKALAEIRLI